MPARSIALNLLLFLAIANCAFAQSPSGTLPDAPQPHNHSSHEVTVAGTPRHILSDQLAIWTSPAHLNSSNAAGPLLLVLATAVVATTDHQVMAEHVPIDTLLNNHAVTASTGLTGGFVAAPAIFYGLGRIHHDAHATETGILGGEAMVDSLAVDEVMKLVSERERPAVDDARGKFFQSSVGLDSSFPSTHSMIAWSSAAVIASEYNGVLTQLTAYGLATGVSAARVLGRQHFPSDVLVGSAVGWMIGRYIVHHRRQGY
ncbi:MAG TPA: phosphatase PAP2 family protein [Terracidiphilus sp.]|nr:phosphatase PAP2 family protein [Terracidiphilus sp.]